MKIDSQIVPQTLIKPRSFRGLMGVYESNYLRLRALISALDTIMGKHRSDVLDDESLYLDVIERTRYTCTFKLTYLFAADKARDLRQPSLLPDNLNDQSPEATRWFADPDLLLRVYFDGRLAEVMSLCSKHRHAFLRGIAASHKEELDARWQRNMMLNKWLEFCLDAGHQFNAN